jgi:tetratricopeptide (TPR) repeat protein
MAGDLESLGRVAAHIGDLYAQEDVPEQGIRLLQPMAASLASGGPSSGGAALYLALTELFYRSGRYSERLEAADRAVEEARALRDRRLLAAALAARGSTLQLLARLEESLQAFEEALHLIEGSGDLDGPGADLAADRSRREPGASIAYLEPWLLRYEPALILSDAAGALHAKGRFRDAIHLADRAVGLAERLDDPRHRTWTLGIRSLSLFLIGDWEQAWADIERGVAISRQFQLSSRFAGTVVFRGWLHLGLGAWEEATRDLGEAIALGERSGYLQMLRLAHGALAEIEIRRGRPADARVRLLPLLDRPGLEEEDVTQLLPVLAWAHLELGELGEADAVVRQAIRRARTEGSPLLLADALRVQGLIAIRQGWWEEAERALDEGLALARSMPYPYAEARLLYLDGLFRTHQGEGGPARERLEAARAIFRRLGARKDIEHTEQLVSTLS